MSSVSPANEYAADTVALILRMEHRKMGNAARVAFENAEANLGTIYVPSFTLAEILYLAEKKRIKTTLKDVTSYIARYPSIREQPLDSALIDVASQITDVSELHDRLIAATARYYNVPLITNDGMLSASKFVQTIWE